MTLDELKEGEKGYIVKIKGRTALRRRLLEMGFISGREIKVIRNAPLNDPIEYQILDYNVSLRRSEAELIEVIPEKEFIDENINTESLQDKTIEIFDKHVISKKFREREIEVALVGNPNCGKTTIFNFLTGSHERVGNYSGVTVDSKHAIVKHKDYSIKITDLPGTYSLSTQTPEELFVRKYILEKKPDIVINVIDASNIERNLFLTTQIIDMDQKIILVLNMMDEVNKSGAKIESNKLGLLLGVSVVETIGNRNKGISDLLDKIIEVYEDREPIQRHIHINYGHDFEPAITELQKIIRKIPSLTDKVSSRFIAIKLLEKEEDVLKLFDPYPEIKAELIALRDKLIKKLEKHLQDDTISKIAEIRYSFIAGALKETYQEATQSNKQKNITQKIDNILTNKYLGFPIFVLFLVFMFHTTFSLGSIPMSWLESGIQLLKDYLASLKFDNAFKDLLIDGILSGVGGVIVFLPNIMILFFFISIMEDTGYMARVSFIMDKLMHKIGLHGKSFIPLIMGFGCNVPAILSTRILENKNDRLLTMLINPFFSCSARLPIYILFIGIFFPENSTLILLSIYLFGIFFAIVTSILFKKIFFSQKDAPFVMELPPYRLPTVRVTLSHMWFKASLYLKKMGTIILLASVIVWALSYFPINHEILYAYENKVKTTVQKYDSLIYFSSNQEEKLYYQQIKDSLISQYQVQMQSEKLEKSFIGMLGKLVEPVMLPLGFDWKVGISIISGLPAKEIIISTLGVLYHVENTSEASFHEKIKNASHSKLSNQKIFNKYNSYAFLIFILLYSPCIASIIAIRNESNSWRWAIFQVLYSFSVAWLIALLIVKIGPLVF